MNKPFSYFQKEMIKFRRPIVLVLMGLFVAFAVVFTRLTNWYIMPTQRVNFAFLGTSICSLVLGPFLGAINAVVADVVGYFLFPTGGAFFPGFTITALVSGIIYGLFFYNRSITIFRVAMAVLCVSIIGDLFLNSVWLAILFNAAWLPLLIARILKTVIWYPVQVFLIYFVWKFAVDKIRYLKYL